ncbi:cytochrome b/b6 domain-containing protein [Sphingomonas sp. ASV193]|uniref:cytochrome b n=1 Tax=Sphingomonas sp. ASV193 TaxID=3144405 RepID=UPI0032E86FFA
MSDYMVSETTGQAAVRYRPSVIALHWISAFLIIAQIFVGLKFGDMPKGPARMDLFAWHKLIGVAILLLALARLGVRLMNPPPPYPADMPTWERAVAVWTHRLFYFLIIALPVTGLAAVSGRAVGGMTDLKFGLKFPVVPIPGIGESHELLAWGLIGLLALHVLAALKHQFIGDSPVKRRMSPVG